MDRVDFHNDLQLWDEDCLYHDLQLWNSHDQQNKDIDDLVAVQLGNLNGHQDHGEQPLLHDRNVGHLRVCNELLGAALDTCNC